MKIYSRITNVSNRKFFLLSVFVIFTTFFSIAEPTYVLKGKIRDSLSGKVVSYANVGLFRVKDSAFVKASITNDSGKFILNGLSEGDYILRVSCIGYKIFSEKIRIGENRINTKDVFLQSSLTSLEKFVVSADHPIYSVDGEKTIYNVAEDPSIQSGTTSDALQNAPGVEVDVEGNVTIRGISSVEIWINDKPSKLTSENLKTYIDMLPANALEKIEVISNPSAKYSTDAEAVINIVTTASIIKNHFISIGTSASTRPGISPWISYVWANEKITFNIYENIRYSYSDNYSEAYSVQRRDNPFHIGDTACLDTILTQYYGKKSNTNSLSNSFFGHFSYAMDTMTTVSTWMSINTSWSKSFSEDENNRNETYSGGKDYDYSTSQDSKNINTFGFFSADYNKKFDKKGHNLRLSLSGNFSLSDGNAHYIRDYSVEYNDLDLNKYYGHEGDNYSFTLNASYNRPYSEFGEFNYGFDANFSKNLYFYEPLDFDSLANDYIIADTLRLYNTETDNRGLGGSVNWTHRWGKFTLGLSFGLKYKYSSYLCGNDVFPDDIACNFLNYISSLHASYRTKSMHNISFAYSFRSSDPDISAMSVFKKYSLDGFSVGNRALNSSYVHNADLNWRKYFERSASIGVQAYARYAINTISTLTDVTDEIDPYIGRIVGFSKPYNMGNSCNYGLLFNATYSPIAFFNLRFYAELYHSINEIDYQKMKGTLRSEKTSYSLNLRTWVKIWNKYQIHASIKYSSPTKTLFSETKARYSANCGLRSDFFSRKLSVYLNVRDIFNWGNKIGEGSSNTNPYYLIYSNSKKLNSRYVSVGIILRFGKMELESKASQGTEISE